MKVKLLISAVLAFACTGMLPKAAASGTKVQIKLDSTNSIQDGELAANLMNAFYLAGLAPRIEFNETGTIETTHIGIDQMSCAYEGLVDSNTHPSQTLLGTSYLCTENDSRAPNTLSAGASYHIMKAVQQVVVNKSSLVGAASFFVENIYCKGIFNVFPQPAGTRDYLCEFDVNVLYEAE